MCEVLCHPRELVRCISYTYTHFVESSNSIFTQCKMFPNTNINISKFPIHTSRIYR